MLRAASNMQSLARCGASTSGACRPLMGLAVRSPRVGGRMSSSPLPDSSSSSTCCSRVGARQHSVVVKATEDERPVVYNKEFGYSRKDVIIICAALIAFGYAAYYGLQAAGVEAGMAGNFVQLGVFMGICVFWVSTYVYRVATKQMTYVKQLEQYEEAVMRKRVEEMTEEEMAELVAEAEREKQSKQPRSK